MNKWMKAALCAGITTGVLFSGVLPNQMAEAAEAVTAPAKAVGFGHHESIWRR